MKGSIVVIGIGGPKPGMEEEMGMPDYFDPCTMCNVVLLGEGALEGARDGETVEARIQGRIIEENGQKFLLVDEVEGTPVEEMEKFDMNDYEKEESPEEREEMMNMNSDEALENYLEQERKYANSAY